MTKDLLVLSKNKLKIIENGLLLYRLTLLLMPQFSVLRGVKILYTSGRRTSAHAVTVGRKLNSILIKYSFSGDWAPIVLNTVMTQVCTIHCRVSEIVFILKYTCESPEAIHFAYWQQDIEKFCGIRVSFKRVRVFLLAVILMCRLVEHSTSKPTLSRAKGTVLVCQNMCYGCVHYGEVSSKATTFNSRSLRTVGAARFNIRL